MKKITILKLLIMAMIVAGNVYSCSNQDSDDAEIFTLPFYVFSANPEKNEFSKHECGYRLFVDLGSPGLFHDRFMWAENLPKEYQKDLLPVIVTFRIIREYEQEGDCRYPIIKIIKIKNNKKL